MERLFKALSAFIAFFAPISMSLPKDGLVEIIETRPQFSIVEAANFFQDSSPVRNLLSPVVKIDLTISLDDSNDAIIFASGTGFGIHYDSKNKKSYIITNSHICKLSDEVPFPVKFYFENSNTIMGSDSKPPFSGELSFLDNDEEKDLCLMVTDSYIRPAKIAKKDYIINQMEEVKIIGAPNGVFPIILDSYVSNLLSRNMLGRPDDRPMLLLSELVFGGQSGSPVYNKKGEVIGVVSMNLNNEMGPIYGTAAIPIQDLREFLITQNIPK